MTNARTAPCQKCTTYLLGGSKMREVVSRGSFLSRRKHLALDDAASYSRERCIWSKRARNKNDVAQRRRNNVGAQTAVCFVKFSRGDGEERLWVPSNQVPPRGTVAVSERSTSQRDRDLLMVAMTSSRYSTTLFPTTMTQVATRSGHSRVSSKR